MQTHPAAALFPLLEGAALDALAADIQAHGLRVPITIHPDGRLLDGRNRLKACEAVGVTPARETWRGELGSETDYVISLNLARRHLDESQRAMVAARLATLPRGRKDTNAQICAFDQPEAAARLQVSRRSVQHARVVLDSGTPALIAAVDQGLVPVSHAVIVAKTPKAAQRCVVTKVRAGTPVAQAMREERAADMREAVSLPDAKYRVLYADPPWSYHDKADAGAVQGQGAHHHYPCLTVAELCELEIAAICEPDAVLFLWVTSPFLAECFDIVAAWGFRYKASFVWDKVKHNMGHYNSVRHEFLLICTRGSCTPDVGDLFDSVQSIERTTHSTKPDEFRTIIDTLYPHGKRIELFARRTAKGWDTYGNDRAVTG
jgi:N6-adenosine-specific RNA methylase IME4